MLRFGVIGTGSIAKQNIAGLLHTGRAQIASLCNRTAEKAVRMAEAFKLSVPVYEDYREMLAKEKLDAALICTPHAQHAKQAIDCANAGLHLIVEKPAATAYPDCLAMEKAVRDNGVRAYVCHVQRYRAPIMALVRWMRDAMPGDIVSITDEVDMEYYAAARPRWCFDADSSGGGILMTHGSHQADRVLYLLKSCADRVYGHVEETNDWLPEAGAPGLDCGYHMMGRAGGRTFVITCGGYSMPIQSGLTVRFTKGIARMQLKDTGVEKAGVYVSLNGSSLEPLPIGWKDEDAYLRQMEDIVDALEGKPNDAPTLHHAAHVVGMLEALKASHASGLPVRPEHG